MSLQVVAERLIICERTNGERVRVTLRLGKPYRASDVDWACPVQAEGVFGHLADIHGVDSFQALVLAQGLLRNLLRHEAEDGSIFFGLTLTKDSTSRKCLEETSNNAFERTGGHRGRPVRAMNGARRRGGMASCKAAQLDR